MFGNNAFCLLLFLQNSQCRNNKGDNNATSRKEKVQLFKNWQSQSKSIRKENWLQSQKKKIVYEKRFS